jgi:hypothetical protein
LPWQTLFYFLAIPKNNTNSLLNAVLTDKYHAKSLSLERPLWPQKAASLGPFLK